MDYEVTGNAYALLHRFGGATNIYHIDSVKVRRKADLDTFLISKNWANSRRAEFEPYEIPEFPKFGTIEGKDGEFSMVQIRDYEPGFDYYGLPKWKGAIYYAKLETLIGQFNANMFDNGLFGSGILTLNSDGMNDEEVEAMVRSVKRDLVGTERGNTGKIIILVGGRESTSQFQELTKEFDGSYTELKGVCEDTIVSACGWKRSLAGLQTQGALGNNQQILNEYSVAMKDIKRRRKALLGQLDEINNEFKWWSDYQIIDTPPINEADGALQGQQIQQMMTILNDEMMSDERKIEVLRFAFGMDYETAEMMVIQ